MLCSSTGSSVWVPTSFNNIPYMRLVFDSVGLFVLFSGKRALIPTSCFPPHTDQLHTHTHVVGGGSRHTHTRARSRRRLEATHTHWREPHQLWEATQSELFPFYSSDYLILDQYFPLCTTEECGLRLCAKKQTIHLYILSSTAGEEEEKKGKHGQDRRWLWKHGIFRDADREDTFLTAVQEDGEGCYRRPLQVCGPFLLLLLM